MNINVSIEEEEKDEMDFVDEQLIAYGGSIEESNTLTQFIVADLSTEFENMGHGTDQEEEEDHPLQMGVFTQAVLMDMEPIEMGIFTQVAIDDMEPTQRTGKRRKRSILTEDIEPFDNFSGRSYRRSRPYRLPDEVIKEIETSERNLTMIMTDINQNIVFDKYSHDHCEASLPF